MGKRVIVLLNIVFYSSSLFLKVAVYHGTVVLSAASGAKEKQSCPAQG